MASRRLFFGLIAIVTMTITLEIGANVAARAMPECPDGDIVVLDGDQVCVVSSSGTITPNDEPIQLQLPRGGGAVEKWCIRHQNRDLDSLTNPWRVPCNAGGWWFHRIWDCYLRGRDVDIDPSWPRRDVADGEEGRVFEIRCYPPQENEAGVMYMNGGGLWQATQFIVGPENPPGYGGTPSVIPALWVEAVNALGMRGPEITTAPPGGGALVNLPVWLWTGTGGNIWPDDPLHAVAEAAAVGQRVDAFAEPLSIDWDMGDGHTVECAGPGRQWRPGSDFLAPGDCHHVYRQASRDQPGGAYQITAITTWRVWWDINGVEDGELRLQVGSTSDYQVREIQVLSGRR